MKYFISGLMAISLIGCSSLFKLDKSDIPASPEPPVGVEYEQHHEGEASLVHDDPAKPPKRKTQIPSNPPLETKKSEAPPPCRNIADEDLWQELRLKFSCIEENVK